MKKFLITILAVGLLSASQAQKGQLIPDPNPKNERVDTLRGKIIYLQGLTIKVDSGYNLVRTAPMLFVGEDGKSGRTDQEKIIASEFYILPKNTKLSDADLLLFKNIPKK